MTTAHSRLQTARVRAPHTIRPRRDLGVGIGLRATHYADFLSGRQPVDWLEVHTENYLGDGGYHLHVLEQLRRDYPLSFHGTGLSIGSAGPLDTDHLDRIASLVDRFQPALVSEHLCWSIALTRRLYDALPLPFTSESLQVVARHVDQVQHRLKRVVLIENVSRHVRFVHDEMTEAQFLRELVRRTGCAILLDLDNLYANQCNHGEDAADALAQLPPDAVAEIHLREQHAEDHAVDDARCVGVRAEVRQLYRAAIERFGAVSTLIEFDAGAVPIDVLPREAAAVKSVAKALAPVQR